MLISLKWLQNYLPDFQISNQDSFRYRLDTRLSEVAEITTRGEGLSKLFIAHVLSTEPHPQSNKLTVCQVSLDDGQTRQIVCGAANVRPGLITVVCLPGGSVYNPSNHTETIEIGVRPVLGVDSNGMLCSAAELGMTDSHDGIIELPQGSPVGTEITDLFHDTVIEIENKAFPHRPDVFSHRGIARELGAIFKTRFVDVNSTADFIARAEHELPLKMEVKDSDTCKRASVVALTNAHIQPSPLWLQIQLNYCGVRSINNVVDITNYIMLDMGQPMHAFDYDKMQGNQIVIRKAESNEQITTLDGKQRKLNPTITVVADAETAQSIAGIMGGADSEVTDQTHQLILEAANWEMYSIRRASRDLGLRSEASTRFEKGMSSDSVMTAITRAANMLLDLSGAEIASKPIDVYPQPEEHKVIMFELNSVQHRLGVQIDKQQLLDTLENLGLEVIEPEKIPVDALLRPDMSTEVMIRVPLFRRDINIPADILEEIARFYGYENFPLTLPKRNLAPAAVNEKFAAKLKLKHLMAASGLNEILTYSMVSDQLYENVLLNPKQLWKVTNPISPEHSLIRDSIVPSLLEKVRVNAAKYDNFGLFEISAVATKQIIDDLPYQPYDLAAAMLGETDELAYQKLKLAIENINQMYFGRVLISPTNKGLPAYLHPGKSGQITIDGQAVGFIGILHPKAAGNLELQKVGIAVLEIDLDKMLEIKPVPRKFMPLAKFPAVVRDMSFWQSEKTPIYEAIMHLNTSEIELESIKVIDSFTKEGKTSFTVRVTIQPREKTLTQEEIQSRLDDIISQLSKTGQEYRG